MRILSAILASAILAGCVSYGDRQAQEPRLVITSSKTTTDYVGCIMPKARERWGGMVSVGPDGDAQVLVLAPDGASVIATLTVAPDGNGSRISYRSANQVGMAGRFMDDIRFCA